VNGEDYLRNRGDHVMARKKANVKEILPYKYRELSGDKLKEALERYESMRYEYGEAVGVVAAQSISEPATQITLRAYHAAGRVQLVTTQGLPRLIEIFDARKEPKTPSMKIYLEEKYAKDENKAREIASKIKETSIKDLLVEERLDLSEFAIELVIDKKKADALGISMKNVASAISKTTRNVDVKIEDNVIIVKMLSEKVSIKDLQNLRMKLRNKHVKGIKGITQILVENVDGEWVITTLGSNLRKVLSIKGVDKKRTYSNNLYEIAEVFGIEAARNLIIKEALETMRSQGVDTDVRHLMLVADIMCYSGTIRPIGRYGVAGSKASVLARANFEETIKHLTKASYYGEVDHLTSIIENVIIGNVSPIGTGMVKIKYKG